jgi:hypothetical protein
MIRSFFLAMLVAFWSLGGTCVAQEVLSLDIDKQKPTAHFPETSGGAYGDPFPSDLCGWKGSPNPPPTFSLTWEVNGRHDILPDGTIDFRMRVTNISPRVVRFPATGDPAAVMSKDSFSFVNVTFILYGGPDDRLSSTLFELYSADQNRRSFVELKPGHWVTIKGKAKLNWKKYSTQKADVGDETLSVRPYFGALKLRYTRSGNHWEFFSGPYSFSKECIEQGAKSDERIEFSKHNSKHRFKRF